jgi:hypothetical protein
MFLSIWITIIAVQTVGFNPKRTTKIETELGTCKPGLTTVGFDLVFML